MNHTAKPVYVEAVRRVELLHRRLLDLIKAEFDRMGWDDISPTQALMMFNMNGEEMTPGEMITRGCYTGTNTSYNLKLLVESGYIAKRPGADRRSVRIKLTAKGEEVAEVVDELLDRHLDNGLDGIDAINAGLGKLDQFWALQPGMIGRRA